jgi:tRNA (cmo5U34)-methyltransferase
MDKADKKELIREKFNDAADIYDKYRKLIIPKFDEFYGILIELACLNVDNPKILDLGAGTGLLTKYLLDKYPQGQFQLIDLSEEMLDIAKKRFEGYDNFKYIHADYVAYEFDETFDIVVSSLSIHHLKHSEKQLLCQKVYDHLNPGGVFLNADQIIGPNPSCDQKYQDNWLEKIEESDLEEEYKQPALERMKFDNPATLEENLKWLQETGFKDVDVFYKYYNFVVLYGCK